MPPLKLALTASKAPTYPVQIVPKFNIKLQ